MKQSENINELAAALSKAQGAMRNAAKDSKNPYFNSKYADIASVWEACREPLAANNLAVVQVPEFQDGKVIVHTVLMHSSGQWISGELPMTPVKADPQGEGSAITYARRYALQGFVGIAPEDDDGNEASGKKKEETVIEKPVTFTKPVQAKEERIKTRAELCTKDGSCPVHYGECAISKKSMPAKTKDGGAEQPKAAVATPAVAPVEDDKKQSLPSTEVPPEDSCIDQKQIAQLNKRFRESLRFELRGQAEKLLHDFVGHKLYLDADGNPSLHVIPKEEYATLGKQAVAFAESL